MAFRSSPRATQWRSQRGGAGAAARPAVGVPRYFDSDNKRANAPSMPPYLRRSAPDTQTRVEATVRVGAPNDAFEREADHAVSHALEATGAADRAGEPFAQARAPVAADAAPSTTARASGSVGSPLAPALRDHMQTRFGADFNHVRVHTGSAAAVLSADLGASAFTHGRDIFYGANHAPGCDALTAHELAHVVQQTHCAAAGSPLRTMHAGGEMPIQRSITATYGVSLGTFYADLQARPGALATPPGKSGLDGYIRFVPSTTSPNSSSISLRQIAKVVDQAGADVPVASVDAAQAPRGAVGSSGVRTQDDAARGVEGGFFTDTFHHQAAQTANPSRYTLQPAAPGTTGIAGTTQQPPEYGGGIGASSGSYAPGFKRSNNPADIRSASLYDFPGIASKTANMDWSFETAAQGEDTMLTYGTVTWGFGVRAGAIVNERMTPHDGVSATFEEAQARHQEFYVHEPVTFYFGFDSAVLGPGEAGKIDTFLAYLARNTDVHLSIHGAADIKGGPSAYNALLSLRRAEAVETALLAKGVPRAQVESTLTGAGATTEATRDAGTSDEPGVDKAAGADQTREANRWANRKVVVTFSHVDPAPAPAPAPTP
jgi:outer membrane protein OmpA-like peptidoglycan-associated protein